MSETEGHVHNLSSHQATGLIIIGTTSGMAVPLLFWLLRDPTRFASELLGINSQATTVPWAWLLAAGVFLAYVTYTFWAVPFVKEHATTLTTLKLLAIPLALVSGTLEELVFRKFLMDGLDGLGAGVTVQVIATALAFGLAHSVWGVFSRDARILLPVVAATTALGAALGVTYLLADRLALPVIVAHIAINLVIEPWLLFSSVDAAWKSRTASRLTTDP